MAIQMVDLVMIKHVTPMFSWETTPSPCKVIYHQMPSMTLKLVPPCVQSWHKYLKIQTLLYISSNNFHLGEWLMTMVAMQWVNKSCLIKINNNLLNDRSKLEQPFNH